MNKQKVISYCIYHYNCWQNRFAVTQMNMSKFADKWMNQITSMTKGDKVIELQ